MATKRIRDMIRHWHDRGYTTPGIATILHLPEPEVTDIINSKDQPATTGHGPEFSDIPLFD